MSIIELGYDIYTCEVTITVTYEGHTMIYNYSIGEVGGVVDAMFEDIMNPDIPMTQQIHILCLEAMRKLTIAVKEANASGKPIKIPDNYRTK